MKYLSVCSGMEAASVAWKHLGWTPVGFSEIEPFPSQILKHHYPTIPNYGDLTKFKEWPLQRGSIDLLVGGTPCQPFSRAGDRQGLNDPRGQLMFSFLDLAERLKPKWIIWENVVGVLSSGEPKGSDFGFFLQRLVECGYGFAYRVLDTQFIGGSRALPQRRRRVYVVCHLGNWKCSAEVLSLTEGLSGYIETSKKKRQKTSSNVRRKIETNCESNVMSFDTYNQSVSNVSKTLTCAASDVNHTGAVYSSTMAVRRITPIEAERLQGFPDNYSMIPWKGKPAEQCPDGHRYRACGNSMSVSIMSWIGERIQKQNDCCTTQAPVL